MMKNILLLFVLLLFNSCEGQKLIQKKDPMKYYDIAQYKDWEFDPEYCWPQSPCSREDKDKFLMKGNERIRVWTHDGTIHVEKSNIINPYIYVNIYNAKTKVISASFNLFYKIGNEPIGISKDYDQYGKVIKEKDWDKPYKFSIQDMIKKFKNEYKIDIENRKNVFQFSRNEPIDTPYPLYEVWVNTDQYKVWNVYIINANTGETLFTMEMDQFKNVRPIEEYLKSIGKFKGKAYKNDPATSQRSGSFLADPYEKGTYQKEELGKAFTSTSNLPKDTYQIYEGKAYTQAEWNEFSRVFAVVEENFIRYQR